MLKVVVHRMAQVSETGDGGLWGLKIFFLANIATAQASKVAANFLLQVQHPPPLKTKVYLYSGHRSFSFKLMLGAQGPLGSDGSFFNVPHLLTSVHVVSETCTGSPYREHESFTSRHTNEQHPQPFHVRQHTYLAPTLTYFRYAVDVNRFCNTRIFDLFN